MYELIYPVAGFAVVVALTILGICVYVAVTVSPDEIRQAPKRARTAWRCGRVAIVMSLTFTAILVAWAVGRAILGRLP